MSELKPGLPERLERVRGELAAAERAAGRPAGSVRLIAVGKTFPVEACEEAYACGQRAFGENYVQEGVEKIVHFRAVHPEDPGEWHFIGPLQANKTRLVAEHFDWVQSVDRLRIASRLSAQRPAGMPPLNILIEVNIDGEKTKSGVAPSEVEAFAGRDRRLSGSEAKGADGDSRAGGGQRISSKAPCGHARTLRAAPCEAPRHGHAFHGHERRHGRGGVGGRDHGEGRQGRLRTARLFGEVRRLRQLDAENAFRRENPIMMPRRPARAHFGGGFSIWW